MATLVLSSVGTALGGPVGAAIGALIGQSFDQQLLGSRSRGPRLGDLSVQTSSYGTQIPRVYGRMRVAGSVVWATDLAESAATTGAKGQPDTVYSYSVSFAVALSSRPILDIGRVWADGKLIRDVDGVFKVPVTFRFYPGSEDQTIDPLIASIEGIAATPAYRGLAIAVFENLELAEFGNRLPFLTFEVLGDADAPTLGAILHDASDEMIACNDVRTVAGYAAYGRSIKAAVEPLVGALGVDLLDDGSRLRSPSGDVVEIDAERELGAGVDDQAPHHQREQAPASRLPTTVRLSYYDPARDYQFGEARSSVGDEMRSEDQRDLPAVMDAAEAKAVAQQLVARAWAERDRMIIRLPPRHLAIEPGASIELPFAPGPWVVEQCTMEGFAAILELRRSAASPAPAFSMNADAGRLLQAGPEMGEMTIALFEAPPMAEGSNDPTFLLAASSTGAGWRSSSVEVTVGAHRFIERTPRRKSVLGKALTGLTAKGGDLEVKLVDATQWLLSCDENALAEGANLAMLGCEMIQFGEAETLGDGRFRLSRLRRGCAGTEWAIAVHETGEDFVLLERDRLQPITIPGWLPASTIAARINPGAERPGKRAVLKSAKRPKKAS